jgi:serine/threonine protein kinase
MPSMFLDQIWWCIDPFGLLQAQTLAKIHHKNLVSLIGYCKDREYMALVYEYMSEGALHGHLRGMQITQTIDHQAFNKINIYIKVRTIRQNTRACYPYDDLLHCREREQL